MFANSFNFYQTTLNYYACWLGVEVDTLKSHGVVFIQSNERDKQQVGYPTPISVYVYKTDRLIVVSYSTKLEEKIEQLKSILTPKISSHELMALLQEKFEGTVSSQIKFYYEKDTTINCEEASLLTSEDFESYHDFFKTLHPKVNTTLWLKDYFKDLCDNQLAYGVFNKQELISVTDAPDMPYLAKMVQEIGVNTLPTYRGQGYAQIVAAASVRSIIKNNKCPLWSCDSMNTASEKLAYRIGFNKLAVVFTVIS